MDEKLKRFKAESIKCRIQNLECRMDEKLKRFKAESIRRKRPEF
jgi:hypothetical protein